jgi:uncharacterized protein YfdQ (DUF2303 family)
MAIETENQLGNVQAALAELGNNYGKVLVVSDGDRKATVLLTGSGVSAEGVKEYLDAYLPVPERMRGFAQLNDLDSLASYINRFKRPETIIFVDDTDIKNPYVEVIFDGHQGNDQAVDEGHEAGWGEFGARYLFPIAPEWKAWLTFASDWRSQAQFAEFLEDRILDVCDPTDPGEAAVKMAQQLGFNLATPGALLALSRGLSLSVDTKVVNILNLGTGEQQLVYEETHKDGSGAPLKVPGGFAIAVPVFRGGDVYRVAVRLKYRKRDGGLIQWQLAPAQLDDVFENAIAGAAKSITAKTALVPLRGRPVHGCRTF